MVKMEFSQFNSFKVYTGVKITAREEIFRKIVQRVPSYAKDSGVIITKTQASLKLWNLWTF
jgi:hypothetical protein